MSGDAIAVCQHPHGDGLHWEFTTPPDTCACWDCDCKPRIYIAVDALLSHDVIAAVARAQYAAEREVPVDPEMYANTLVRDEYTKFARIGLQAASAAALRGEAR